MRVGWGILSCPAKIAKKITLWRGNLLEERGKGWEVWGRIVYERGGFENLSEARGKDRAGTISGKGIRLWNARESRLNGKSRGLGVWHSYSADLPCRSPQFRDNDFRGRYSDRKHCQNDGARLHLEHANLRSNHRPKDFKGYGEVDETKKHIDNIATFYALHILKKIGIQDDKYQHKRKGYSLCFLM